LFDPTSQKSYSWHNDEKIRNKGDVTVVKHTLFYFILLDNGRSFNDRDFAKVPLA
jgi:hypothetical protein